MTQTPVELDKGGNGELPGARVTVTVRTPASVDVCALLLTARGKVRDDEDLVFFNHPEQDGVRVAGPVVEVDLDAVPSDIETVVCAASVDAAGPQVAFDAETTPSVSVNHGAQDLVFVPPPPTDGETVLLLVELYRRGDGWKVRAVGQGYANGLAGMAADFGVAVEGGAAGAGHAAPEPAAVEAAVVEQAAVEPAVVEAAVVEPVPAVEPVAGSALGRIELVKNGTATIALDKSDPGVVVTASLEWGGGGREEGLADLDLYALFVPAGGVRRELTDKERRAADRESGKTPATGAVYWNNEGSLEGRPHLTLDGDAKEPGRETIRIHRPDTQGYVLICAYSALDNGTGSFRSFGAKAVVTDGRGSTVVVPLFSDQENAYWAAIALVDFTHPDGVMISQVETYSGANVENRPMLYADGVFRMDLGPVEFKEAQ
ncbi:TerD family protein [Streptomyces sp. NPDC057939]|uniref:TerD family protein n=1 Tax=Streptomyces sp. NPDC057939 TaxID=3346284 RepID=UPI0036F13022